MYRPERMNKLDAKLAAELLQRTNASAVVGLIGVGIMYYVHRAAVEMRLLLLWSTLMASIFGARVLFGSLALKRLSGREGDDALRFVNVEAFLCTLAGLGWASSVYGFESGELDARFYLRLMILAAGLAFTMNSMGVFKRVFIGFAVGMVLPVAYFLWTCPYLPERDVLLVTVLAYLLMVLLVSGALSDRVRKAMSDHLEVISLTERLQALLKTETELRAAMSTLAMTDELTRALNRRAVIEHIEADIARCRRHGHPLAVVMLDLDFFKLVNDTYGHATGDLTLQRVATALREVLRTSDAFGRFGGEEFLIGLPTLSSEHAMAMAERLRLAVEQAEVRTEFVDVRITASLGLAFYRDGDDSRSLLGRADAALYRAKHKGRNRCEVES